MKRLPAPRPADCGGVAGRWDVRMIRAEPAGKSIAGLRYGRSGDTLLIWEAGRFHMRRAGATALPRTSEACPGSERAAEDPLGARE